MNRIALLLFIGLASWAADSSISVGIPWAIAPRGIPDLMRQTGVTGIIDFGEQNAPTALGSWPMLPAFSKTGTANEVWEAWDRQATEYTVSGTKRVLVRAVGDVGRLSSRILSAKLNPTKDGSIAEQVEAVTRTLVKEKEVSVRVYPSGEYNGAPRFYVTPVGTNDMPIIRDTLALTMTLSPDETSSTSWGLCTTETESDVTVIIWRLSVANTLSQMATAELCVSLSQLTSKDPEPDLFRPAQASTMEMYRRRFVIKPAETLMAI